MKHFDWTSLLQRNPLLSGLGEGDIARLLDETVSVEKEYGPDSVILTQGEVADSLFLIGVGAVDVVLADEGDATIPVTTLRSGEFFGEMALLAQRPISATVRATERCVLLQVQGARFLHLVDQHPEIELKVLSQLRERLRHLSERALASTRMTLDEKLTHFNHKLDAELNVMGASLRAARAAFDHTKQRTDELIARVERGHTRMIAGAAILGTIGILVIGGLTWVGYENVQTIVTLEQAVTQAAQSITKFRGSGTAIDDAR